MSASERGGLCAVLAGITNPGHRLCTGRNHRPRLQGQRNMHKHLRRLESIWIDWPIYFITTCTLKRRSILASKEVAKILIDEWRCAHDRHGWAIGRYVIMPDHVHFFCSAELDAKAAPNVHAGMVAVDKQADGASAQFFWKHLA